MNKKLWIIIAIVGIMLLVSQKKTGVEDRFMLHEIEGVAMDETVFNPLSGAKAEVRVFPFSLPLNTSRWIWNYSDGGFYRYREGEPQADPLGMFIKVAYERGYFDNFNLNVIYDGGQVKTFYLPDLPTQQQNTVIYFYSDIYGNTYYDFELTQLAGQAPISTYSDFMTAKNSYLQGTVLTSLTTAGNYYVENG